jgi:hypothetical protein
LCVTCIQDLIPFVTSYPSTKFVHSRLR